MLKIWSTLNINKIALDLVFNLSNQKFSNMLQFYTLFLMFGLFFIEKNTLNTRQYPKTLVKTLMATKYI